MSNKNKVCKYIIKNGPNKGKECGRSESSIRLFNTYCFEHEDKVEEEKRQELQNKRQITKYDFFDKTTNFDIETAFSQEKDVVKFVDGLLASYLFLHPLIVDRDRNHFCIYENQLSNFSLYELEKELELRGFEVYQFSEGQTSRFKQMDHPRGISVKVYEY